MKKQREKATVANIAAEMAVHMILPVAQLAAIIAISCAMPLHDWTFWVILSVLIASLLYFGSMFVYKLYRARLTFVTLSKSGAAFYSGFKKQFIAADDMAAAPSDYGKPNGRKKYVIVYSKSDGDIGFLFALSCTKSLAKYKDIAPQPLLKIIIAYTLPDVLEAAKPAANDELSALIKADLEEREATKKREEEEARKKRKKGRR